LEYLQSPSRVAILPAKAGQGRKTQSRIALTPSTTFAVTPGHAPNAIRLALAAPPIEQLDAGLRMLSGMLNAKEEDFDSTE
jgi:hypothetical protein